MIDDPMHDLLPVDLRDGFELVAEDVPRSAVSDGFQASRTAAEPDVRGAPDFQVPSLGSLGEGVDLRRWQHDHHIVLVEFERPPLAVVGTPHEFAPNVFQLDANREPFALLFREAAADVLVLLHRDGRLEHQRRPRSKGTIELRETAATPLELPPIDLAALEPLQLADWLVARAQSRAGRDDAGSAEATGLLVRLGHPGGEARRRELMRTLSGEPPTLIAWANEWLGHATEDALDELDARAREAASELLGRLDLLGELLASDRRAGRTEAQAIIERRDDEQSIGVVLALSGRGDGLRRLLDDVDRRALELGGTLSDALGASESADEWLASVHWQEPEAWWGRPDPAGS